MTTDARRAGPRSEILIAVQDSRVGMRLSVALSHAGYDLTVIHGRDAFQAALATTSDSIAAMIVGLDGRETTVDLRSLFRAHPKSACILLAAELPPHAAVTRIAQEAGALIFAIDEQPIVIEATLVAMLGSRLSVS